MNTQRETRYDPYVVFSVASPEDFEMYALNTNLPVKRVIGCYKGQLETSFVMQAADLEPIVMAGWLHGEESVLWLHAIKPGEGLRRAELRYLEDGRVQPLGFWRPTNPQAAKESDGYTYDPTTETFYVAA